MSEFLNKTRTDAWGEDLDEELRWQIFNLTKPPREGDEDRPYLRTYEDAQEYLAEDLKVVPPSRAGWYRFLARMRQAMNLKTIYRVAGQVESAKEMAGEAKINFQSASDVFRAQAIDAAMDGNDKAAALYASAATAFAQEARKAEELRLAREKFEAAERRLQAVQDAVDAAKGGKLDPARVADEIDKILGRKK